MSGTDAPGFHAPRPADAADRDASVRTLARRLRKQPLLRSSVLAARRARTALIESWLGVRTEGLIENHEIEGALLGDAIGYAPTDYLLLSHFMRRVPVTPEDVVVDVGCGMGRLLCLYGRMNVRKCVGIECDPSLVKAAQWNAARLRGRRAPIEVRLQDATVADYSEGTLFWLFNPFGAETLRTVLERIRASMEAAPRRIRIVYVHPVQEEELARCGWLIRTGRATSPLFLTEGASYWSNEPDGLNRPAPR